MYSSSQQIPSVDPFTPHGDPSTVAQKWSKLKKSFEYFLVASEKNDGNRQRALLLHLIGSETQEIIESFNETGTIYKQALDKLYENFSEKKHYIVKRTV